MIKYIAFDPGETTGYATFDEYCQVVEMGHLKGRDELYKFLATGLQPELLIIEQFTLFGHKAKQQTGSKMETTRVIGALEMWASQINAKVVMQPSSIKPIAEKWSGMKPPSNHSQSHRIDAYNHGFYYFVKNNMRKVEIK